MEKFNRFAWKYLLYVSPVFALAVILDLAGVSSPKNWSLQYYLFDLMGWMTVLWILLGIYQIFRVGFQEKPRNAFVRRLAGICENDEREVQLTGTISKRTFITMTGVLFLLLFLSALQIRIYKYKEHRDPDHRNGAISVGLGMSVIKTETDSTTKPTDDDKTYIVRYEGLPLTADGTLLLVMALQIGAFYYFSKKEKHATT